MACAASPGYSAPMPGKLACGASSKRSLGWIIMILYRLRARKRDADAANASSLFAAARFLASALPLYVLGSVFGFGSKSPSCARSALATTINILRTECRSASSRARPGDAAEFGEPRHTRC